MAVAQIERVITDIERRMNTEGWTWKTNESLGPRSPLSGLIAGPAGSIDFDQTDVSIDDVRRAYPDTQDMRYRVIQESFDTHGNLMPGAVAVYSKPIN